MYNPTFKYREELWICIDIKLYKLDWWTVSPHIGNFNGSVDLDYSRYGSTTQVYLPGSPGSLSYQSWWWGLKSWVGRGWKWNPSNMMFGCLIWVWVKGTRFETKIWCWSILRLTVYNICWLVISHTVDGKLPASLVNVWKPFVQTKMVMIVHILIHPNILTGFQLDRGFSQTKTYRLNSQTFKRWAAIPPMGVPTMNSLGQSLQELSFGPRLPPSGTANFRCKFAVQNAGCEERWGESSIVNSMVGSQKNQDELQGFWNLFNFTWTV